MVQKSHYSGMTDLMYTVTVDFKKWTKWHML